MDTATKMAAARTRLILDKPFFGALALRLPLVEVGADRCRTTRSDGKHLYYYRAYIDSLDIAETQFALSRESLHCALLHFYRRGNRDRMTWNKACDLAVNSILIRDGLQPTPDTDYRPEFDGMTAEEIYPLLIQDETERSRTNRSGSDEDHQPPSSLPQFGPGLRTDEMEMLATQWRQRLAAAAQQAMQADKLSAELTRVVGFLLQPKLPWRSLLAQHLSATARNDYSYARPSSRRGDPAVFPGLRSEEIDLVVAVDTSGSIRDTEIEEFFSEINAIKGQIRARIALLCCDSGITDEFPLLFEPWDNFDFEPRIGGGGGTDFRPVFEWVERQDSRPDSLVYFTDACGEFPRDEPNFPTLWLVKGGRDVPFGARIQLNE